MDNFAKSFIEALNKLEESRDDQALLSLFAEDCTIGNVAMTEDLRGQDGARQFWKIYRDTFGEVHSRFLNTIVTDSVIALEWKTEGTAEDGSEILYTGVSIIEVAQEKITRFQAYFDPAKLAATAPVSAG